MKTICDKKQEAIDKEDFTAAKELKLQYEEKRGQIKSVEIVVASASEKKHKHHHKKSAEEAAPGVLSPQLVIGNATAEMDVTYEIQAKTKNNMAAFDAIPASVPVQVRGSPLTF